jgi:hypothetical protein
MTMDMTKQPVVYSLPGMAEAAVKSVTYAEGRTLDVYAAAGSKLLPVVVFVSGYPDPGMEQFTGKKLKDWAGYVAWSRLVAASGMAAVAYANRDPRDVVEVLRYLREHGEELGIDASRIAVWGCSGNAPMALSLLMTEPLRCGVLAYGFLLDAGAAAARFHFVDATAGKSVDDLPRDLPLFIARAGKDEMPGLNDSIDRFVAGALARNLPLTLVNNPTAPHAFDLVDDSEATREVIRRILAFLAFHLGA